LGYNYTDHHAGPYSFSFGSAVTALPSAPDASKNYKPDWSYNEYDNWIAALNHEQKLSEHTNAFLNAGYHREDWYGYIDGSPAVINNNGDYSISLSNYPLALTKKYLGIGIKGDFTLGKTRHDYVVSLDKNWYSYWLGKSPDFGNHIVTGNLYETNSWPSPVITHFKPGKSQDMQMFGWHITDTISADNDRLQVLLGLHGHRADQTKAGEAEQKYDAVSPTFAINYRWQPDLSVYASHTENFAIGTMVPTNKGYANAGQLLDPNKTKQNEVGVKFKSGNLLNTLSLFQIEQSNYNDFITGDGAKYYKEHGKQKNKGIEWAVSGSINDKLDLMGGIMYLDAEQTLSGKQVNGAAKWSTTLGAVYKATDTLSLIARTNYLGSATINDGALKVPSHFTVDLGAAYKVKMNNTPVTLQLMCYNLTNKDYWMARAGNSSVLLGAPRTIVMSASLQL
jgi:iron complex outermembrane receptor protein